jgi:hypothetical protein
MRPSLTKPWTKLFQRAIRSLSSYDGRELLAAIYATAALGATDAMTEWRIFNLEKHIYDALALMRSHLGAARFRPGI